MKKLVSLLLALVLVFAFAATATAATWNDVEIPDYSDVEGLTEEQQVAIYTLTALGITEGMNGWGGAYAGDTNFTREQLAKIAIYLVGEEDAADLYASFGSAFSDVQEGRWSEGYINLAYELGLMKGVSTTSMVFAPTSTVSYQEYVTVVLRAIGYDDNLPGNWPADYSNKAVRMGLTKYTDYVGPKAIDRADMAVITNNALDEYMVTYVGRDSLSGIVAAIKDEWVDNDGYAYNDWFTNEENWLDWEEDYGFLTEVKYGTLLSEVFGCAPGKVELVFGNVWQDLKESAGWNLQDGELYLETTSFELTEDQEAKGIDVEVAADYYIYGADLIDIAGQYGNVLFQWNEDDEMWEVLFVEILSNVEIGAYEYDEDADFAKVTFGESCGFDWDNAAIYTNDEDEIYAVYPYDLYEDKAFGIVDEIDGDDIEFKAIAATGNYIEKTKAFYDDDEEVEFILAYDMLNGKFVSPAELEEGDVVYYAGLVGEEEGIKLELVLVYGAQTGEWEKASSNYIKVDGEKYDALDWSLYSSNNMGGFDSYDYHEIADFDGAVTYGLSYIPGAFTYISDDVYETIEGVVVDFTWNIKDEHNEITEITLFQADGEEYTYEIDAADADGIEEGDYVELVLEDGETVDSIAALAEIADCDLESVVMTVKDAEDALLKVVDSNSKDAKDYSGLEEVADDAVIYVISLDGAAFDAVEIITAEELLEGDDYVADQIYISGDTYVIYELWDGHKGIYAEGMDLMGLPGIDALVEVRDGGYVLELWDGEEMDGKSVKVGEGFFSADKNDYADFIAKISAPGVIVYDLLKGEMVDFYGIINGKSIEAFWKDASHHARPGHMASAVMTFTVDGTEYSAYDATFVDFQGKSQKVFIANCLLEVGFGYKAEDVEFNKADVVVVDLTGDEAEIMDYADLVAGDEIIVIADGDDAVYILLVENAPADDSDVNNDWEKWFE